MYGENKILKIFSLVAFVAFAAVSCWSTTESLFLSLEHAEIPKWVFWIAVVGLYVLTSYCFKMMIDSFDQNVYMEHRTLKFVVGLLGILLLWIAFSMPTNTHTFFYKQMAKDVAVKELTHVDAELLKLSSENAFHETYNAEWHAYETKVLGGLAAIKAEIADYQNIGMGDKAEARVAEVEDLLGVKTKTIARLKPLNHTYDATMAYFDVLANKVHDKSVIVIDDIHHSQEMEKVWKEICADKRVFTTIDLYQMGLVFFDKHYWRRNYRMRL